MYPPFTNPNSSLIHPNSNTLQFNQISFLPWSHKPTFTLKIDPHLQIILQPVTPLRFPVAKPEDSRESPRFFSATSQAGSSRRGAFSPTTLDYSRSLFSGYSDCPNYMTNTDSSRAKARSQSAPKQRPELEKSGSIKRLSSGIGHGHGFSAQRSSLQTKFANKAYPGSGRLDSLGMPMKM